MKYHITAIITLVMLIGFSCSCFAQCTCGCSAQQASDMVRVVLQAAPGKGESWPSTQAGRMKIMKSAQANIEKRLVSLINGKPTVEIEGDNKLIVTFPQTKNTDKIIQSLTARGELAFYWLKNIASPKNPKGTWMMEMDGIGAGEREVIFTNSKGVTINSKKQPQTVLDKVVNVKKNKPVLTGKYLLPNAKADFDPYDSAVLRVQFNDEGTRIFKQFTARHIGDFLAIFFDGKLLTAPEIREAIPGGSAQISGFKSVEEAKRIADLLNAGTAPVELKLVSKQIIKGS